MTITDPNHRGNAADRCPGVLPLGWIRAYSDIGATHCFGEIDGLYRVRIDGVAGWTMEGIFHAQGFRYA